MESASDTDQQGSGTPDFDLPAALSALREVVRMVDAGEFQATSPERAHLVGAIQTLEVLSGR